MNSKTAPVAARARRVVAVAIVVSVIAFITGEFSGLALSARNETITPAPAVLTANTCESLPGGVIEVEGTGGSGTQPTGYATLGTAFTAINLGHHAGAIVIDVCGNTNESGSGVLNASGAGAASYSSILIRPVGGAARTISGAVAAPLIDLSGADNVTIDGLNSGGNSLTITNLNAGTTSATSTIRFVGDAANNTITNSTILGSATMSSSTNGGTIFFSTAGTSGNDNNTISNCNIGPSTATLPTKAIYANGSTGSQSNSGITITGNNIFDFLNATGQSNGVLIAGGNTGWTISNNKFFQTAPRTTSSLHVPIQIASGTADGMTISGNTIGYSSGTGTGTYAISGNGTRFYPIYLSTHGPIPTSIQGNTITNISLTGGLSGNPFSGILIDDGRVDIGNIAGNVIGSSTAAGAIFVSSSSASSSTVFGIDNSSGDGSSSTLNNTIGGIVATNTSTGAIDLFGLRAGTGSVLLTSTVQNNTVGFAAAPLANTATSSGSNVAGIWLQSTTAVVTGNTVSNLTMAAGNTSTGSGASVIGIWLDIPSSLAGNNVSQNVVRNLSNTDTINNNTVTGIFDNSGQGPHFAERNLIYGLSVGAAGSATGTVNGIEIQTGNTTFQNNMIALGNGVTAGNQISGIRHVNGGTNNFYHNSIYIGGSDVVGTAATYAVQSTITTNNREFRDNIFVNARSNGTGSGKHYAVRMGGTGPTPGGLTINNNVYFASGTGGVLGFYANADRANLAAWQAVLPQDADSFESDPGFVNPAGATPDLHINAGSPTVVEAGGADVGVGDDFDGQTRSGLTPVDIGADAGNFTGIVTDTTPPTINYTALANTTSTANRVLTAAIADAVAVANGTLLPRIYFRKNAGAYVSTQCVLTSGNQQSGTYDCTIDNLLLGGVAPGDTVGYFVIAQDTAGNVASNPAGVAATNVNTVTTPPPTPNTYSILQTFTGTVSVGSGEAITSLTNNGGLFQALNAGVLTGNTTINITGDLTAETGTHSLNQLAEEGVGGYTLFFQASGGARLISGSNATALINLNGADRVTFSGLALGPGGLTFRNTGNGATIRFINDATFDSILSCTVEGGNPSNVSGVVLIGAGTLTGNDNISITDSTIRDRTDAAAVPTNLIRTESIGPANSNITISGNQLLNFTQTGIIHAVAENVTVSGNTISQASARSTALFPLQLVLVSGASNSVTQNVIRDHSTTSAFVGINLQDLTGAVSVTRNRVFNIDNAAGSSVPFAGVQMIGSNPASAVTMVNNMVSIPPATASSQFIYGVYEGRTAGTLDMNYNSVLVGGTATGTNSWVFLRGPGSVSTVSLTGNILFNDRGGSVENFAIGDASAGGGSWSSNYNLFVGTGATPANFFDVGGTAVDFAAWKAGLPARDADSIASVLNVGPFNVGNMFSSANDLHLRTTGFNPAVNAGTDIGVTTDFDGQTRPFNGTPDIGADEVQTVPTAADASITGRVAMADGRGIRNVRVVVTGGSLPEPRVVATSPFGYYRIDGLRAGETYVVSVSGKRYVFETPVRVVSLGEDAFGVDFVGQRR